MHLFLYFQSSYLSCIYILEVMFSLGRTVLCLLWGGVLNWCWSSPSAARRERESRIVNVVPGLRPGFLSFDVEHWTLSAQTMQQTSTSGVSGVSCIRAITHYGGNGRRDWWDWIRSCHHWTHPQSTVFVRQIMIFYVFPIY